MRDLQADLKTINEFMLRCSGNFPYIAPETIKEYLERAILAEDCMERRQDACGAWMKKCEELESKLQESLHYRADFEHYYELFEESTRLNLALTEENDIQRASIQEMSKQSAILDLFVKHLDYCGVPFTEVPCPKWCRVNCDVAGRDKCGSSMLENARKHLNGGDTP